MRTTRKTSFQTTLCLLSVAGNRHKPASRVASSTNFFVIGVFASLALHASAADRYYGKYDNLRMSMSVGTLSDGILNLFEINEPSMQIGMYFDEQLATVEFDHLKIGGEYGYTKDSVILAVDARIEAFDTVFRLDRRTSGGAVTWDLQRLMLPPLTIEGTYQDNFIATDFVTQIGPRQSVPKIEFEKLDIHEPNRRVFVSKGGITRLLFDENPSLIDGLFIEEAALTFAQGTAFFIHRTPPGDADNDGRVGFGDFVILANHFGQDETHWENGDFDRNHVVDFADFLILTRNFGNSTANVATVPEPIGRIMMCVGLSILCIARRSRKRQV